MYKLNKRQVNDYFVVCELKVAQTPNVKIQKEEEKNLQEEKNPKD